MPSSQGYESAAQRPRMMVFGKDAYPRFEDKVAALMHSIARNHSLVDGDKRLAWSSGRIFFSYEQYGF